MKLLQHTVKSYLIYSALILLIAIPIFYFIIQALCLQDVDEALRDRKKHLIAQLNANTERLNQLPWYDINDELVIYPPVTNAQEEKELTLQHYNTLNGETEPFRELRTFVTVNGRSYPVILRISLINIEDLMQGIVLAAILLMILILGGLIWINRIQSKKIWQPFYKTLDQLKNFSLDKKTDWQQVTTNISEFNDLQQAAAELTERTYKSYQQQKEFTENAAHEMQTPVAAMQSRLDVLMQDEHLTMQQTKHIQVLEDAVIRMSKLNKGLLLLAKIENKQFQETEQVNMVAVTRKVLSQLSLQRQLKKLTLRESYKECVITSNPVLIDILLTNLLNNAIQYAPKGSTITVNILPGRMEVSNTGEVLSFSEEKIFNRFQKGEHADAFHGNGLGLAIVKQICDVFHYKIHYCFKDHLHRFIIDFNA